MARIETDPNYSAPTFSRATAATDLFKKEDVQGLAAAMSIHNHNAAGNGALLNPPDNSIHGGKLITGSILAAQVGDGQITTAKLQASAVTAVAAYFALASFSTTAVGANVSTPVSATLATTGGPMLVTFSLTFSFNAAIGTYFRVGLSQNGGLWSAQITCVNTVVSQSHPVAAVQIAVPAPGTYTWVVQVNLGGAGTLSIDGATAASLDLTELKR